MRVVFLAAILAALVWVGWRAFAPQGDALAAGSGGDLGRPMEVPAPSASATPAPLEPLSEPAEPVSAAGSSSAAVPPVPAERESQAAARPPVADEIPLRRTGSADEVRLGHALAHRLQSVGVVLAEERARLSEERALLTEALADALGDRIERSQDLLARLESSTSLRFEELDALRQLIRAREARLRDEEPRILALRGLPPLVLGALLAHDEELSEEALRAGRAELCARALTECFQAELSAPWEAERPALEAWSARLKEAQAAHRWNPRGEWPAIEVVVEPGDNLIAIRKRVIQQHPELLVCVGQIVRANRLVGDVIQPGKTLRVPAERAHVLVDLGARWMLYYLGDEVVGAWEVGTGRPGQDTRPGTYRVGEKREEPMWWRPGREPVPFGDPENPLGTRWIEWLEEGASTGLGFHGTSDPDSIGQAVSDGCIRLRNPEVEDLFEVLPREAEILVRP